MKPLKLARVVAINGQLYNFTLTALVKVKSIQYFVLSVGDDYMSEQRSEDFIHYESVNDRYLSRRRLRRNVSLLPGVMSVLSFW